MAVPCESADYFCFYRSGQHYHLVPNDWRDWRVYRLSDRGLEPVSDLEVPLLELADWWCYYRFRRIERLLLDEDSDIARIGFDILSVSHPRRIILFVIEQLNRSLDSLEDSVANSLLRLLCWLKHCLIIEPNDFYQLAELSQHLDYDVYRAAIWVALGSQPHEYIERAFDYLKGRESHEIRLVAPVYAFMLAWSYHPQLERWLQFLKNHGLERSYFDYPARIYSGLIPK